MVNARNITENGFEDTPRTVFCFIIGQFFKIMFKQSKQRFVGFRFYRIVKKQISRVFVFDRISRETFPDKLAMVASVLSADKNFADGKINFSFVVSALKDESPPFLIRVFWMKKTECGLETFHGLFSRPVCSKPSLQRSLFHWRPKICFSASVA